MSPYMKDTAMAKKFDAAKLAALFGDAPVQTTVKEEPPSKQTQATKKIAPPAKSAKGDSSPPPVVVVKPPSLTPFLELPPSPDDKAKLATTKIHPEARVMRYNPGMGWGVCIQWLEQGVRDGEAFLARVHALVQGADGALSYEKMRPEELKNFCDIKGGYPIGPAIDAFRAHADRTGATREARALLGMSDYAPPKMLREQVRDEDGKLVGERMVAKLSKNDPSLGPPKVSADVDELYSRAAKLLELKESDLRDKYKHLNPGLQAMNLRNRLRAKGFNA